MANSLVVERTLNAPVEKVWNALTDKVLIEKWFVPCSDFKAEPGFEFTFLGTSSDGKGKKHLCRVIEAIQNKKISYSWRYEGFPGDSLVTWELSPHENGTKLTLTHEGLETFPSTPPFARENYEKGWAYFTERLQALLETN